MMDKPVVMSLVSYKVFPAQMGGQKHIAGFYRELSKHATVLMVASRQNKDTGEEAFPVSSFLYDHWKAVLNLVWVFRLVKMIRRHNVTVLVIEHSYFGFLGWLLHRITGVPFVIRSHNIEALRFRDMGRSWWWLYGLYEKWVHRRASYSFFITEEDRRWAIANWQVQALKSDNSSYGITIREPLSVSARNEARKALLQQYQLSADTRLFFFNGTLDYLPNRDALRIVTTELLPLLRQKSMHFRIIVCGRNLEPQWKKELASQPEIIYQGFVKDISPYFSGTDCLINPITLGGGIRTKMIEALAHGQSVISTKSSSHGIEPALTGSKLVVVPDYDWSAFAAAMAGDIHEDEAVPEAFYTEFAWTNIVRRALLSLQTL